MKDRNKGNSKKFVSIFIIVFLVLLFMTGFVFINFTDRGGDQHTLSSMSFAKSKKAENKNEQKAVSNKKPAKPVTVFVTSWCYYCKITIDFLKENKIPFIVKDIEKNTNYRDEMIAKASVCRGGVPVLVVNDEIHCGFNPYILNELVKK